MWAVVADVQLEENGPVIRTLAIGAEPGTHSFDFFILPDRSIVKEVWDYRLKEHLCSIRVPIDVLDTVK